MPTFHTPGPISVEVDMVAGSVHLIASERSDTTIVVNPDDPSEHADVEAAGRTMVDLEGRTLVVRAPRARGIGNLVGFARTGSVDVTIELPEKSSLQVKTGAGDVTADGVFGDTTVETGAGAIHLDRAAGVRLRSGAGSLSLNRSRGDAEITTAGDIQLTRLDGDAEIKNQNGKTWIGEVGGGIGVRSANGDIRVDLAHSSVSAKTSNGSIGIGEVGAGEVNLETGFGGVEVGIREGAAAWVDATTRFGRVINSLEATGNPGDEGGRVAVRARTSFGDIHIHRSRNNRQRQTGER